MCGRGGRSRVDSSAVEGLVGVMMEVERREAAMVRRRWDSVLRVADVMQAMHC